MARFEAEGHVMPRKAANLKCFLGIARYYADVKPASFDPIADLDDSGVEVAYGTGTSTIPVYVRLDWSAGWL